VKGDQPALGLRFDRLLVDLDANALGDDAQVGVRDKATVDSQLPIGDQAEGLRSGGQTEFRKRARNRHGRHDGCAALVWPRGQL
jgi:hypothetical protein